MHSVEILHAPSLTSIKYEDMSLSELLETRDRIHAAKDDIESHLFGFAMAKLQMLIHHRRTHRKSGLVIPYDENITSDD